MGLFLKNVLFTVVVPGTVGVYMPLLIARGHSAGHGITFVLALLLFLIGGAIYLWCVWDFATVGRGTPTPLDAPKVLVRRGLYRYTRNPMYVGVLIVILGWTVLHRYPILLLYAGIIFICFHLMVVLYEERRLTALFGQSYTDYCEQVGRWLPHRRQ